MKLDRNKYLESRSLEPKTPLIALLIVNVLLGLIVLFFPKDGIQIGDHSKLKFISLSELRGEGDSAIISVDIDQVLSGVSPVDSADNTEKTAQAPPAESADTSIHKEQTAQVALNRSIQLPPNNPDALRTLLHGIKNESKTKVIRILHYGDSQLEGDRITDYLRNRMQQNFGGEGPGFILPNEPAATSRRSAWVTQSNNMKKSAIYVKGGQSKDGRYGIGGASFSLSGASTGFLNWEEGTDSIDPSPRGVYSSGSNTKSYIKIKNGSTAYPLTKKHSRITLLYDNDEHFQVRLTSDNYVNEYTLPPSAGLGHYSWDRETKKKLTVDFTNGKFPTVYGIALDGKTGVAVDNFAMRGSSAIGFDKMDRGLYTRQLRKMNVRCIILQYGINVVPNVRSDYGYYKNILVKQLKSVQAANPGVSIIVIGPSDMSRNRGGNRVSYSNIPLIRDAMRSAAFETNCCFWDLYEAMGGQNSMSAWVEKGLGQRDYTHFSYKGARYVGEMLYNAIMEQLGKE